MVNRTCGIYSERDFAVALVEVECTHLVEVDKESVIVCCLGSRVQNRFSATNGFRIVSFFSIFDSFVAEDDCFFSF